MCGWFFLVSDEQQGVNGSIGGAIPKVWLGVWAWDWMA